MKSQKSGRFGCLLPVILLAAAGVVAWKLAVDDRGPAVIYETSTVKRGDIEAIVTAIGALQPRHSVEVGAQVSGQIMKLHVQPGQVVEKGALLVEIDASVHEATVEAGRAALEVLRAQEAEEEAQFKLAGQQLARQERMAKESSTREEDVQTARAEHAAVSARLRQRRASITEREASLRGDEALLGYTKIYAPMSGTIIAVKAREGQTLNATYATPTVLSLAELDVMTVWTGVAEADIDRVQAGMPAFFTTLGHEGRRWSGTVRQVLPMAPIPPGQEETAKASGGGGNGVVQYTALFDVDNKDAALLPRMTAQVSIQTDLARDVLIAPLAGLEMDQDHPGRATVRQLGSDGQPRPREIRFGKRDRRAAQITEGLSEGESIIIGERPSDQKRRFVW